MFAHRAYYILLPAKETTFYSKLTDTTHKLTSCCIYRTEKNPLNFCLIATVKQCYMKNNRSAAINFQLVSSMVLLHISVLQYLSTI